MKIARISCKDFAEGKPEPLVRDATKEEEKEITDFHKACQKEEDEKPKSDKERIAELEAKLEALAK